MQHNQFIYDRGGGSRRVVITGLGAVCAAGNTVPELWRSLLEGRSGIDTITCFSTKGMESSIAGEVKDFDPLDLIEPRLKPKRLSRQSQFAVVATAEAVCDARLTNKILADQRVGIVIGSSSPNVGAIAESALQMQEKGPAHADASMVLACNSQGSAIAIADLLNVDQAMAMMISTGCASGVDAVRVARDLIRSGRFDTVFCGGSDAPITKTPYAEFSALGMNSRRNDDPAGSVRPFDRESDDSVVAEGAAMLVLENAQTAFDRAATPYVEILGSYAAVDPDRSVRGSGLALTMRGAMQNALCEPGEIDFISAWGCGNPISDRTENECIKMALGSHAYNLAVGSIKGVTGLPLGAAGVLQIVAAAMSHRHSMLPPTLNSEYIHPDFDLDYVRSRPRRVRVRKSIVNAHGMGGNNVSLVLAQPRDQNSG